MLFQKPIYKTKIKSLTDLSKLPKTYLLPIYYHDLYLLDKVTTHRGSIFLLKDIPSNSYSVHQVKLEIRQYPAWGTSTLIVLDKADSVNGYYVHLHSPCSEHFLFRQEQAPGSLCVHDIFCLTIPPGFYYLYNDVKELVYVFIIDNKKWGQMAQIHEYLWWGHEVIGNNCPHYYKKFHKKTRTFFIWFGPKYAILKMGN